MGLTDELVSGLLGSAGTTMSRSRSRSRPGRWRQPRERRSRAFVPVIRTPWLTVAAVCVLTLLAAPVAIVVGLVLLVGVALGDDTLGVFLLVILGPVAVGGITVVLPVIASGIALVGRTLRQDGSTRAEVLCTGLAGSTLTLVSLLSSGYVPLLVVLVPSAALVAIGASPAPWRRRPHIEWSNATSTVNS